MNQLYICYSEMLDKKFNLTANDIKLSEEFYRN
jgi:hypothetical protein